MSGSLFNNPGAIACNFCSAFKVFNARNPGIIYTLCKNCYFVYCKSARPIPHPHLPGHHYTRSALVDLSGPHGMPISPDCHYWNPDDNWPKFGFVVEKIEHINPYQYHLLTYKPDEDREFPLNGPAEGIWPRDESSSSDSS